MKKSKPVLSVALIALFTAIPVVSQAMEVDTQILPKPVVQSNVAQSKAALSKTPLKLYDMHYMRSALKDVQLTLIGPVRVTIEDDYVQRRFEVMTTRVSKPVSHPDQTASSGGGQYFKATAVKTGFKFKF